MKKTIKTLLSLIIILLIFACTMPGGNNDNNNNKEKTGTIALSFIMTDTVRTILPQISMVPVSYTITGAGPNGRTFNITITETSVQIPKLKFGDWTVTVEALNADRIIIGSGQIACTVITGQTVTAYIIVRPLEGYGTLNLSVLWNAEDTESPSIDSQLIPYSGSALNLDFTVTGGNTATYTNSNIQTGYHTLIVKLLDSGLLAMGAVEVVRIVKDQTSSGTFEFTEINKPGGAIVVNIIPEMNDPLTVTMSGQVEDLAQGQTMTVNASVAEAVGNVVYVWYINGDSVGTGENITVGSGLDIGVYRLDVTAFTVDGKRAGSASCMFNVVEGSGEPTWQQIKILASDGDEEDYFGFSVSISGDGNTILISALYDEDNGAYSGSVYIHKWNGTNWQETKIIASDGDQEDVFGISTSISSDGNTFVAGANWDEDNGYYSGSAYVFRWNGSLWQEYKITPFDGTIGDYFGSSVSISGDGNTVIVSSFMDDDNGSASGSIYVYNWDGINWQETKITASDGEAHDNFGRYISSSADGNIIVAGAYQDDDNGTYSGSVYVYNRDGSGWQETKIIASDGKENDRFGIGVSVSNDGSIIVVNSANSASIYIYKWNGSSWQEINIKDSNHGQNVLLSGDGQTIISQDYNYDVNNNYIPVINVYNFDGSVWQKNIIISSGVKYDDSFYAYSISSDGRTITAGAHKDDDKGLDAGAAYIFRYKY